MTQAHGSADLPSVLSQPEAFARIRLLRSPKIGPVTYRQLLARFGSAIGAIEALPELGSRGKFRYQPAPKEKIEREIEGVIAAGARYLFHDQPDYPELLSTLSSAPPIINCRGQLALASKPCVAVVGARSASAGSVKLARTFANRLAQAGFTVVSGLARGIDGAAHQGALDAGKSGGDAERTSGGTIGVIASGIDIAYPSAHAKLQDQIAEEGLLIAEQPPGTEPRGQHFPSRNRIIAGLSSGTLVVEAAPKSGSLITARLAAEAGREVMAIPGSPLDTRSFGCNQLIRDGAVLISDPKDVIELLETFTGAPRSRYRVAEEAEEYDASIPADEAPIDTAVIEAMLSAAPIAVDELIRQSGASNAAVQMALLELELSGTLERHESGQVSLIGAI